MKKETSIAIGMGVAFGLLFSFLVIVNTQKNKSVSQKTTTQKNRPVTTQKQTLVQPITLSEPSDGAIVDTQTVKIKGKTDKDSFIVIQSQTKDAAFTTKTEAFEYTIPLSLGENVIHLSSYPKGAIGKVQEKEIRVYYLNSN